MCLISKDLPKISTKNITIYKVVMNKMGSIWAPCRKIPYLKLPEIYPECTGNPSFDSNTSTYCYGKGFVFAFLNKEIAQQWCNKLNSLPGSIIYAVYEGKIPIRTEYVMDDQYEICAKRIILNL